MAIQPSCWSFVTYALGCLIRYLIELHIPEKFYSEKIRWYLHEVSTLQHCRFDKHFELHIKNNWYINIKTVFITHSLVRKRQCIAYKRTLHNKNAGIGPIILNLTSSKLHIMLKCQPCARIMMKINCT